MCFVGRFSLSPEFQIYVHPEYRIIHRLHRLFIQELKNIVTSLIMGLRKRTGNRKSCGVAEICALQPSSRSYDIYIGVGLYVSNITENV